MNEWEEFLRKVRIAKSELGETDDLWYRGHSNNTYELVPSLFRYANGEAKEQILFEKFEQAAARQLEGKNDWDTLVDMQHYGVPTRLLEWSEVLGVALYFACHRNDQDGHIWILNPTRLNARTRAGNIVNISTDGEFDYKGMYWRHKPSKPTSAIAATCVFYNSRIANQRGYFTIHSGSEPLDYGTNDFLRKVEIPKNAMSHAQEFLTNAGINEFRIFPDLIGLSSYLKRVVDLQQKTKVTLKKLRVTFARYGANGETYDVTDILNSKVANGELDIIANNDLFGDPIPGTFKELVVEYELDGEKGNIAVQENGFLQLPLKSILG